MIRVRRLSSGQRLPRALAHGLAFSARPATWHLLSRGWHETADLVQALGGTRSLAFHDLTFVTERPQTTAAFDHLAHLAMAFGIGGERIPDGGRVRHVFGRLARLDAVALEAAVAPRLDAMGVAVADFDEASLVPGSDGRVHLRLAGSAQAFGQVVFADDAALLELMGGDRLPAPLGAEPALATLTAPARPLPSPTLVFPDRGVTLVSRPGGAVLALVDGPDDAATRLGSVLPGPFPLKRLATSRFHRVVTADGAPVIGPVEPAGVVVLAGLGAAGAFFAPALARWLTGETRSAEADWFGAHASQAPRQALADLGAWPGRAA